MTPRSGGIALLTFAAGALLATFIASPSRRTHAQEPAGFTIGDVRMSLLNPAEFRLKNGDGWALMRPLSADAEVKAQSDRGELAEFYDATGLKDIPDARGVFLRGMNVGRDPAKGDPSGDRGIGEYQNDDYCAHNHNGGNHTHQHGSSRHTDGGMFNTDRAHLAGGDLNRTTVTAAIKESGEIIKMQGGPETRPRNVTVYVYVKVK